MWGGGGMGSQNYRHVRPIIPNPSVLYLISTSLPAGPSHIYGSYECRSRRGQTQSIDDHMECPVTFFLTVIWAKIIFLNTLFSILYEPHFPFSMNCAKSMLESTRMEKLFLTPSLTFPPPPTHPLLRALVRDGQTH